MRTRPVGQARWRVVGAAAALLAWAGGCMAHGGIGAVASLPVPPSLQVSGRLPPLTGVTDLKFRDFYSLPVGPQGLQPSAALQALDGQRVRIVGYMVRQGDGLGPPGVLLLAPLPLVMATQDEGLADDLPATVVYAHLDAASGEALLPHREGLMALSGILQVGGADEADGRRSMVRLMLDEASSRALVDPLSGARALLQLWRGTTNAASP